MKLWLLRPIPPGLTDDDPWDPWYDKAFGFVVRAETEEQARAFAHDNAGDENREAKANTKEPWKNAKYSSCVELTADGDAEVVIKDFMAA
jgi:hypothetical protein